MSADIILDFLFSGRFHMEHSGIIIRDARLRKGYRSQRELANAIGVSHPVIANWERGDKIPGDRTARLAAGKLDIDLGRLLVMMDEERHEIQLRKLANRFPDLYKDSKIAGELQSLLRSIRKRIEK